MLSVSFSKKAKISYQYIHKRLVLSVCKNYITFRRICQLFCLFSSKHSAVYHLQSNAYFPPRPDRAFCTALKTLSAGLICVRIINISALPGAVFMISSLSGFTTICSKKNLLRYILHMWHRHKPFCFSYTCLRLRYRLP